MRKHKILNKDLDQLSLAELLALFYVDDGAMIYSLRQDMINGTKIAISTFAKFGLIVYFGTNKKASKTEAVFFPSTITLKKWRNKAMENRIANDTCNNNSIMLKNNNNTTINLLN